MKKVIFTLLIASFSFANAQVILGDAVGTATNKTSVLLDFAANQNKGIIVPYVRTLPTGSALVGGAIILDATTATTARMKYYNETVWVDLSGQNADVTTALAKQPTGITEDAEARAIIGTVPDPIPGTFPEGALVLNSTTKAMVLPTVADVQDILSPSPGMMVYVAGVSHTFYKPLAVFNGSKWSFWKP